jgi:phytoene dehydrogenase-like protein
MRDKIENAAVSEGFFTVYLVLNVSGEEFSNYMKYPHIYNIDYKPGYDIFNSADKDYFSKSAFYFYSPSMINPALAPVGKSSLMIQCRVPHRWMDNWGGGNRKKYHQLKQRAMNTLIDRASEFMPALKESISFKDAATPLTYERFTHNSDGASSAWSWNPKERFHKNVLGANIETPVKNLLIGSCWAVQVGGVPGAIAAAYECVKRI